MLRTIVVLTFTLCAFGQQQPSEPASPAPPPAVDTALRERVKKFYQAHVDGKYRLADQVVADESKDLFFAMNKQKYDSFDIVRINYSDDFTKADAVVATKGTWYFRGQKMPVTMPITSKWKVIDGEWFWYVVPTNEAVTPFGTMHFDKGNPEDKGPVPALPADPKVLAERILSQVQADKDSVRLSSYEPSKAEVRVRNGMQGEIKLRIGMDGAFAGLTAKLDKETLSAGDTAVLTFICKPKDKSAKPMVSAQVIVEPTQQVIPIKLTFAIPPEVEKTIPKELRR
jgi:hypothetical protein